MDVLGYIIKKVLKQAVEEKKVEEKNKVEKKKYIYIFSRKKFLRNNPESIPYEKIIINDFGSSWEMQCDGKEIIPIDSEKGLCYGKETDVFPYIIYLKDCIKRKA